MEVAILPEGKGWMILERPARLLRIWRIFPKNARLPRGMRSDLSLAAYGGNNKYCRPQQSRKCQLCLDRMAGSDA